MYKIDYRDIPEIALQRISARQRSYIDEFTFYVAIDGRFHAHYAGELVGVWNGENWEPSE